MVDHLFRKQYGLVEYHQALDAGLTRRQIERHHAAGRWMRVHRGVYRHAAVAPTWESKVLAACLATGGIASHRTAAALWRLDVYERPRPEIVVPRPSRRACLGVRIHQTTQWQLRSEFVQRGIPVTGIDRTILDCGAVARVSTVERVAEAAIRKQLTSWASLAHTLMTHSRKGRDGCGVLRSLLELRLGDRTLPLSDFSRLVFNLLVDNGVPSPELEYRIHDRSGGFIMQADLAWPDRKKVWELDGLAYHFGREDRERDNRKRNRAKAEGWNVQEILWSMYVEDPESLVAMCHQFLDS